MLFNWKTSVLSTNEIAEDIRTIIGIENYLNSLLEHRGYVYLNQVYEELHLPWDPKKENRCYNHRNGDRIKFDIRKENQGINILNI